MKFDYRPLIERLADQRRQLDAAFDLEPRFELRDGADSVLVREVEEALEFDFPPSYRDFLVQFDGLPGLTSSLDVLGTVEFRAPTFATRVRAIREAEWDFGNRVPVEGFVIGWGDESSDLLLLDRTVDRDARGEFPVVLWGQEEVARQPDFRTFLEFYLEVNTRRLQQLEDLDPEQGLID